MKRWTKWALVALATGLPACERGVDESQPVAALAAAVAAKNPFPTVDRPRPADARFGGRVEEARRAGPYTYMRVTDDAHAERWIVTLGHGAPVGARVSVRNMGTKRTFRSRRLGRVFDELVFGIVREDQRQRGDD